jgi:hypothetical protein
MSLPYSRVWWILKSKITDPAVAFQKSSRHNPFAKLHALARKVIERVVASANYPLYVPEI